MSALRSARPRSRGAGTAENAGPRVLIVQVIPSLRMGGLENVAVRLVEHLTEFADQAVVTPGGTGPLAKRVAAGVPVFPLGETHRPDKWNAVRMARLFRMLRPDIVHTRNWRCIDAIIGAWLAGVRVVIHGEHGREAAEREGRNRLASAGQAPSVAFRRRVRHGLARPGPLARGAGPGSGAEGSD